MLSIELAAIRDRLLVLGVVVFRSANQVTNLCREQIASSDQRSLGVSAISDRALLLLPGCLFALLARPGCEFDICTARINEQKLSRSLSQSFLRRLSRSLSQSLLQSSSLLRTSYIEASADEDVNAPGMHAWIDKGIIYDHHHDHYHLIAASLHYFSRSLHHFINQ